MAGPLWMGSHFVTVTLILSITERLHGRLDGLRLASLGQEVVAQQETSGTGAGIMSPNAWFPSSCDASFCWAVSGPGCGSSWSLVLCVSTSHSTPG